MNCPETSSVAGYKNYEKTRALAYNQLKFIFLLNICQICVERLTLHNFIICYKNGYK